MIGVARAGEDRGHESLKALIVGAVPRLIEAEATGEPAAAPALRSVKVDRQKHAPAVEASTVLIGNVGGWEAAIGVLIVVQSEPELLQLAEALGGPSLFACRADNAAEPYQRSTNQCSGRNVTHRTTNGHDSDTQTTIVAFRRG